MLLKHRRLLGTSTSKPSNRLPPVCTMTFAAMRRVDAKHVISNIVRVLEHAGSEFG